MDSIVQKRRGERKNLSKDGGAAVLKEWNEKIGATRHGWGPYKNYASFVGIRARDKKTIKDYLTDAGYAVGNAAGGRAANGNTGGNDEDQGGSDGQEADEDNGTDDDQKASINQETDEDQGVSGDQGTDANQGPVADQGIVEAQEANEDQGTDEDPFEIY